MLFRSYPRKKQHTLFFRITWRTYYLLRRVVPVKKLLKVLLNSIWTLNGLVWEQTRLYEKSENAESKIDLLRPRNVLDATSNLIPPDRVCDFGGGLGDISDALVQIGCNVVYCDTNPLFQKYVSQRFSTFPNFRIAESERIVEGKEGTFNLFILSHVLEHIDNPTEFLANVSRISKTLHVEVPDLLSEPLNFIRMKLELPVYRDDDHVIEMSLEYLKDLIESSNFTIDSISSRDGCLVAKATSTVF